MAQSKSIWKQLLNRKAALISLIIIAVAIIMAIFAAVLATDKTPNANTMILELGGKPIGFTKQFIKLNKVNQPIANMGFNKFWNGTPNTFQYVPINGYKITQNGLEVYHFIDDNLTDTLYYDNSRLGIKSSIEINTLITNKTFILGTDRYGRDIWSRLMLGSRISLAVGFVSVILSIIIGIIMGGLAGWYGGIIDDAIMWVINILWSIPTVLLVFAITLTIGKGFWEIFIAIGLTSWVGAARMIRGQVMQLKSMEFITAAKALGYNDLRILRVHVLPNIAGPILVIAASNFAAAILTEAGLSFLGVGVQPPTPSWGLMIKEHYNFLISNNPMPALIPGFAIMILVLAFNILGNALSDLLNVKK